jgi:hypothetical protein
MIIRLNICVSDIEKGRIKTSDKNGKKYLSLSIMDSRNSDYSDGFISHDTTKEERDEDPKARGKIVGNWKWVVKPDQSGHNVGPAKEPAKASATSSETEDDLPF